MFQPIITSLLDTDLYKFTMLQAMLHNFPANQARYEFLCRNKPSYPLAKLKNDINAELDSLCDLTFKPDELDYLRGLRYISSDFVDFLAIFRLQRRFITVSTYVDTLKIVAEGPQIHVMLFEIFVLSIVNELYFRRLAGRCQPTAGYKYGENILFNKIHRLTEFADEFDVGNQLDISDFGTRRRFSKDWQAQVVDTMAVELPAIFKSTSNVFLAKKTGLMPVGTMAHEYLQMFQGVGVHLKDFQKAALECWVKEYRGDLGIALTDVVGMDSFLNDFDTYFAKLFDGLRHDSGDPVVWANKAIQHYEKLNIDPRTKRLVFSDGLTVQTIIDLYSKFNGKINLGFGIGTNLTNDVGYTPLNIVMKLTLCNGQPVAKLPDSSGKTLCTDETFLNYLRDVFPLTKGGVK
jgi:nicotinate phosphoribosyltransferase